tara:strand:+ start:113 stop:373 length:261 start_codon:yes stop_codon:yes gene_type:complete
MEKEHYEELAKSIELAAGGQWMPLAILAVFFGLIIFLLLFIYKKDLKSSDQRHKDNEVLIKQLTVNQISIGKVLTKLETKVEILEK